LIFDIIALPNLMLEINISQIKVAFCLPVMHFAAAFHVRHDGKLEEKWQIIS
jgi:hypothetical protein